MEIRYKYKDPQTIQDILRTCRTQAVVGLSSQKDRAGYYVPAYMQSQGYRIIPVNPYLSQTLEEQAYPDLGSVPEPVDLVLIFRRSEAVPPFVEAAIQIGARAIWMQLGIVNLPAAQAARQAGLQVVMNACIMVEHRRWRA
ncbi:MAG TPA: CoA-binding protein [Anaerolineales bacterium]|nr:CoA-binding protein [Anaerolineales bacterium]